MVVVVSEEEIESIGSGREGYSEKVVGRSVPMFRGKKDPRFQSATILVRAPYETSYSMEVKEGEKLNIGNIRINAFMNVLMKAKVEIEYRAKDGTLYVIPEKYEFSGYGEVRAEDIGISIKGIFGEREIPFYGTVDVESASILISVLVFTDRNVSYTFRAWGSEEPL